MTKHPLSSLIAGIILIVGGVILIPLGILHSGEGSWVALIYGIPMLVIGIVLLLWKKEDEIEQRKDMKGGNKE